MTSDPSIRQLIFYYEGAPDGTFGVWHTGKDIFTVYDRDGHAVKIVRLNAPHEANARRAAEDQGQVVSVHKSASLYYGD